MRVLIRSTVLALAIGVIPLAGVAAHECIVVHRSASGNAHATASGQWITVTLTDIYESTEQFGFPDLTNPQVAYAVDLAASLGIPDAFTFRGDKLIGENASGWQKGDHATDGKGIDHFFEVYGDRLIGALFAALANA